MDITKSELITCLIEHLKEKDLDKVTDYFSESALFIDPHYPKSHMKGRAEISAGVRWSFRKLRKFDLEIIRMYPSEDGRGLGVLVQTAHELNNGRPLNFPQLLIFEFEGQLIQSLHVYVQYRPPGILGLILKLARARAILSHWGTSMKSRLKRSA